MEVRFPTLLIVDDDLTLIRSLQVNLEADGFDVITSGTGKDALDQMKRRLPDMAVVDLLLPDMHGFELCRRIKNYLDVPIIMLTGVDSEDSIVNGLELYAEDYVVKPFSYRELLARINRVLKRTAHLLPEEKVLVLNDEFKVDFTKHCVQIGSREVRLTPIETRILAILARNPDRVVSTEGLMDEAWPDGEGEPSRLWVNIGRLRNKIEPDPDQPRYIVTERGVGYRLAIK